MVSVDEISYLLEVVKINEEDSVKVVVAVKNCKVIEINKVVFGMWYNVIMGCKTIGGKNNW